MIDAVTAQMQPVSSQMHRSEVTPRQLAWRLGISEDSTDRTLRLTSHRAARVEVENLTRRFRTRQAQLGRPLLSKGIWSDTFFSEVTSTTGNTCAQMFCAPPHFVEAIPMKSKGDAGHALGEFVSMWGIPKFLRTDQAKEEWDGEWGRVRKHFLIPQKTTEPYSPWQNACEFVIGQHKKWARRIKQRFRVPEVLWDDLSVYRSGLQRCTIVGEADKSGIEELTWSQWDVSDYMDFHFYETVKFCRAGSYPENVEHLGKWLGPSKDVRSSLFGQNLSNIEPNFEP